MPAESALTPLGRRWRDELPVVLRNSPEHIAVVHSVCSELERLEIAIERVRAEFFPRTADMLLGQWERILGITEAPVGLSLDARRTLLIAALRKMRAEPSGLSWQQLVTDRIGPTWTYQEHDPAVGTSPPDSTIRVTLPFPPDSSTYAEIEALLREITPAHLDIEVVYSGGFVLDQSQLDQEGIQ